MFLYLRCFVSSDRQKLKGHRASDLCWEASTQCIYHLRSRGSWICQMQSVINAAFFRNLREDFYITSFVMKEFLFLVLEAKVCFWCWGMDELAEALRYEMIKLNQLGKLFTQLLCMTNKAKKKRSLLKALWQGKKREEPFASMAMTATATVAALSGLYAFCKLCAHHPLWPLPSAILTHWMSWMPWHAGMRALR